MSKQVMSVVVEQYFRHEYLKAKEGSEYEYKVVKTVNTIEVVIGQLLTPEKVNRLIQTGVNVTVQPVK